MNPNVRMPVGRSVGHKFIKIQEGYASNAPIGALYNWQLLTVHFTAKRKYG